MLQAKNCPKLKIWLQKYTSSDIQNEILKVMALHVFHDVISQIQKAPFFSIMVDDISNKEQVAICCRRVDVYPLRPMKNS